jgi:hypothetical protein
MPSVLPVAGEGGRGIMGGLAAGLGLTSLGVGMYLRSRRKTAEQVVQAEGGEYDASMSDVSSLPLDQL